MGQQILEDWNCSQGAVPTAGNPTTFTCPEPHNFVAGTRISLWNASGGSWANMNNQERFYLRLNINAATTTQIQVSDTQFLPQTGNFVIYTETNEQILVNVATSDILNIVTRGYNSTTPAAHPMEDQMWGPSSAAVSYPITITGPNTFTIPFNSTGFGAYSGNTITLQRSSFTYTSAPAQLQYAQLGEGASPNIWPQSGHYATLIAPGCASPSSSNQSAAFECARGYFDPANQKGYGGKAQVSSLVVSGGNGTITLASAYSYNGQEGNRTLGPNQLVWLQGMNEGSNAFNSINRPWIMSAVNGGLTQITIPGMGGQGVVDGTYTPSVTPNNFWLEPPASLYYWFYGDFGNGSNFPAGYTQQLIKSGPSFNANDNRVNMYICWGKTTSPFANSTGTLELGNYFAMQPSGTAYHGYQSLNNDIYANQCGLYTFTSQFGHLVGASSPAYLPNNYSNNGFPSYPPWTGETGHNAWELVNHFYIDMESLYEDMSGQTIQLGQMTMDYKPTEPEEYISSRGVIYTGSAYEIDLQTNEGGTGATSYQFRWSTSDMTAGGFSTGICQSGSTACSAADSVNWNASSAPFLRYTSAALPAPSPTIYWGIRPTIPVAGVSGSGQSPIWINTDFDPNMAVGDHITVSGLTGNTAANQTNTAITGIYPRTTWWYTNPSPTWPAGATPGKLQNIVCNGSSCTVNLTVNHGIVPGWRVMVWSTLTGDATHGYRFTVTSTPTPSSFTFASNAAAGTYASDTANTYHMAVLAEPGLSVAGTGNGNWANETAATLVSTENYKNFAQIAFSPGVSSASSGSSNPCDLNGDGVVNVLDVNLAVAAALGTGACTARLDGSTQCTIIDVQRVATAALGGTCNVAH